MPQFQTARPGRVHLNDLIHRARPNTYIRVNITNDEKVQLKRTICTSKKNASYQDFLYECVSQQIATGASLAQFLESAISQKHDDRTYKHTHAIPPFNVNRTCLGTDNFLHDVQRIAHAYKQWVDDEENAEGLIRNFTETYDLLILQIAETREKFPVVGGSKFIRHGFIYSGYAKIEVLYDERDDRVTFLSARITPVNGYDSPG